MVVYWLPGRPPAGRTTVAEQPRLTELLNDDIPARAERLQSGLQRLDRTFANDVIEVDKIGPAIQALWTKIAVLRQSVDAETEPGVDRFAAEAGAIRRRLDDLGRQANAKSEY
jgi:hypothetical protein